MEKTLLTENQSCDERKEAAEERGTGVRRRMVVMKKEEEVVVKIKKRLQKIRR